MNEWSRGGHPTLALVNALRDGRATMPDLVKFNGHMIECVECHEAFRALSGGKSYETAAMDVR